MSDIPVGSPPAPPGRHAAPGGWYPDPLDGTQERYWDGWQWSRNTRAAESAAGSQPGEGAFGQPTPGSYPPQQQQQGGDPAPNHQPGGFPQQNQQPGGYPPGPDPQQYPYPQQGYPQQPYPPQGYPHQQYAQQPYGQQPYPQPQGGYGQAGLAKNYTADGVPLAGWWWRVLAVLIDAVIVGVIAAIPSAGIYSRVFRQVSLLFDEAMRAAQSGQPAPIPSTTSMISTSDQLLLNLIAVAVGLLYHVLFVRFKGATPGKMACGLRVVPTDVGRHTDRLPWSTAVIRAAVWVLPKLYGLFAIFRLLDALFPLWHPKRQALHDLAARTQVVKLR